MTTQQPSQFHLVKAIEYDMMFYDLECIWLEAEFWGFLWELFTPAVFSS